jgi:Flp pilus assembly protein TadG
MSLLRRLVREVRAAAAAELAMVTPLILALMFGAAELGNYFYNEHILLKAVRDGARYAARQSFTYYEPCTAGTSPGGNVVADTRALVKTGLLAAQAGAPRFPDASAATINVTMNCTTTAGTQTMSGIYKGRASGAPRVTVTATVPYTPLLASLGFNSASLSLNATEQAAVMGI